MIHQYSQNGVNIVMDVESGAVHILEDLPYEILHFLDENNITKNCPDKLYKSLVKYSREDIESAYAELYSLYQEGLLFSKRDYEINLQSEYPIKALCLHISHDCNLRCKYCFADGGDFMQGRKTMPLEVAKKAIDFIIARSENRKHLEVDFFGGEPLMNFDVVKQTVQYARSIEKEHNKEFRFTLTTNGVLLDDDVIDFVNKEMSNVVLSLDGRKCVNDDVRITPNNKGSYDAIVPKFQKLVRQRQGKDYYVRGTFTAKNLDFSKDVMHIHSLGFDQVSVEPVVLDKESPMAIQKQMLPEIFKEYDLLAEELIALKKKGEFLNFFHFMIDLDQGPCVVKRVKGCGSGTEYVAVTPDGDIYPCHRFVGNEDFKMGNVMQNFETDKKIAKDFAACTVLAKPDCEKCFAKYYCSGGCAANNYNENGDILKPHEVSCELERKRTECAIYIKACEAL
ncbi:MAG: thioether cross-link-forming SCIFF peptide maturase [Clostridiales bacterium]|nr:MAG: thioether cross-link-forming SCIFF peptide maturase [Clostridiales bacterium]